MSENEIASLQLTGKIIKKRVEWKNPDGTVQNQLLDSVQVVITGNAGRELSSQYLYGDLVGVRAKIIRFPSFFNMLGIKNVCYIDALYNGYRSMERHNRFPHQGIALMPATTALGKIWEKVFYRDFDFFWIKAATLESHYFPLFEISGQPKRGSFELTISSSGLSSRKAVQKSAVFHDAARNKNNDFIYTHAI